MCMRLHIAYLNSPPAASRLLHSLKHGRASAKLSSHVRSLCRRRCRRDIPLLSRAANLQTPLRSAVRPKAHAECVAEYGVLTGILYDYASTALMTRHTRV